MKKYWKTIPLAAIVLLYGGAMFNRPLFAGAEIMNGAVARFRSVNGLFKLPEWAVGRSEMPLADYLLAGMYNLFGSVPAGLRLPAVLGVLLTAGLIYLAFKKRSETLAVAASMIFASSPLVFAIGTTAGGAPLAVLMIMLSVFWAEKNRTCTPKECGRYGLGCGLAGGFALLLGGIPAGIILAFYGVLAAPRVRMLWQAPAVALVISFNMLCKSYNGSMLWQGFDFSPRYCIWLIAGVMPWILFLPAVLAGLGKTAKHEQALAAVGLISWVCAVTVRGAFPVAALGGTALQALFFARLMVNAISEDGGLVRFNRQVRTVSILLCTALLALAMVQLASRFMKVDPSLLLYRKNENWFMTILAMFIPLLWWYLSVTEREPRIKIAAFAVGSIFALLTASSFMPGEIITRHALEKPLRKYVLPQISRGTKLYAAPKFLPALYLLTGREDIKAASAFTGGERNSIVLLDGFPKDGKLPPAQSRFYLKDASLLMLKFN